MEFRREGCLFFFNFGLSVTFGWRRSLVIRRQWLVTEGCSLGKGNSLERHQRAILLEGLRELDDAGHVGAAVSEAVVAHTAIGGTKPLEVGDSWGWMGGGGVLEAGERLVDGERARHMFGSLCRQEVLAHAVNKGNNTHKCRRLLTAGKSERCADTVGQVFMY